MELFEWILGNKTWIFSGIGVFILTIIYQFATKEKKRSNKDELSSTETEEKKTTDTVEPASKETVGNSAVISGDGNISIQSTSPGKASNDVTIPGNNNTNIQNS